MTSKRILDIVKSTKTVSSILAEDTSISPGTAVDELRKSYGADEGVMDKVKDALRGCTRSAAETVEAEDAEDNLEELVTCGRFGQTRPSELFLRVSRKHRLSSTYSNHLR